MLKARCFSERRFGTLEAEEGSFVHLGMALGQETDTSAALAQGDFTKNSGPLPKSREQ